MDQDLHQLLKALVARHTLSTNEAGSCENAQVQTSMPWQEHLASLSVRLEALCAIPAFLEAVEASASQIGVTEGSPEYGSHASVNEQPQPFPAGQLTWKGHAVESPLLACAFARAVAAAALSAQGAVSNEAAAPAAEMGSELKTGCRPDAGPSPQLSASTDITSNGRSNGHAVLMQQWLPRLLPCSVSMQPHQLTSNTHWAGVLPRVVVACALMEGGTSAINALVQQCLMHLPLYGQAAGCQATYTPLDTSNTGTSGTTVLVLELAGQGLFSSQRAQQQQGAQQQQAHRGLTLGRAFALSVLACACRLAPHSLSGAAGCEMVRVFGSLHGVEDAWGAAGVRHLQGSSWPAPAADEAEAYAAEATHVLLPALMHWWSFHSSSKEPRPDAAVQGHAAAQAQAVSACLLGPLVVGGSMRTALAVLLQPEVETACLAASSTSQGVGLQAWLSHVLPRTLLDPDRSVRAHGLHLLRTMCGAGVGPRVAGWADGEWQALTAVLQALEENMLHLVEPVWSTRVPALLRAAANTEPPAVFPTTPSAAQCMGELPCCIKWTSGMTHESGSTAFSSVFEWLSLPFVRGTKSTNAGIRRLALASLLHAWAHGVTPCSKVPGSVDGGPGGSMGEASSSGAATSSSAGSSSSTWLQQMVGMEGGVQPLLQLLQRLLPVLDSEILSQEELPGASSQAHAASVQQLRMLMSAAFTSIMQVMLLHGENPKHAKQPVGCAAGSSMPVVDTTEHGKDCTDWDPNALLPIQMVLEHCLGGTQRSCAVVFLVQALGDALERLCTSGTDSRMASLGHALRLQYIPACCQMLRSHLHPLAGRQALLHPRPLHVQLLHGVAWIASILVDPFACSMDDSARFLSVVCSTGAIASAAVAWQLQQLPQQLQVWLVEALVGSSTGGTGQVPTEAPAVQWMQQQLHASTSDTQTAVPIHAVQAVAGAAPLLPLDVQRSLLQAVLDASSSTTTRSQPQALQCRVLQYARLTFLNSFLDSACAVAAAAALGSACKQLEQITHACFIWHEAVYITHLTSSQAASQLGPTAAGVVANAVPSVPVLLWDNACCQAMLKLTSLMSSAACSVWAGQILLQYSSPWRIALVPQLLALAAAPSLDHQVSVMCSACIALAPIASPDLESTVALAILQALTSAPPAAASCNAVMLSMEQACSSMAGFERSTRIVLLERFQLLRQVLIGHLLAAVHAVQCTAPGSSQLPPDLQLELASCCIEELDAAADEAVPLLLHNLLLSVPWDGLKPRRPQDHNQTQEGQALQALEVVQQGVKQGRLDTAGDEVGQEECLQRSLAAARLVSRLLVQLPAVLSGLRRRGGGGAGGVVSGCGGSMGMDAASMLPRVFLHPFIMLAGLGQQATAVKASSASKGNGGSKTASTDSSSSRRVLAQVQAGLHARIEKETIPWLLTQGGSRVALATASHLCTAVMQPHPLALAAYLPHLLHLLVFSRFTQEVDLQRALTERYEPQQHLATRASVLAWLEGLKHDPKDQHLQSFLDCLALSLLRIAQGGTLPATFAAPLDAALLMPQQTQAQVTQQQQETGSTERIDHRRHGKAGASTHGVDSSGGHGGGGGANMSYAWLSGREASTSSAANQMKVCLWQALCLAAWHVSPEAADAVTWGVWTCMLNPHQHANIRPMVQTALLVLLNRHPQSIPQLLLPALRDYSCAKYQVCVSLVLVGSLTLLHQLRTQTPQSPAGSISDSSTSAMHSGGTASSAWMCTELLSVLTPWALHHHHAVRVPAQALLYSVLSELASGTGSASSGMQSSHPLHGDGQHGGALMDATQRGLLSFLSASPECVALRSRQALVDLAGWRLEKEAGLEGLLGVRPEALMPAAAAAAAAAAPSAGSSSAAAPAGAAAVAAPDPFAALAVDVHESAEGAGGLSTALHARDRLPIDILRALPPLLKSLRRRPRAVAAAAAGRGAGATAASATAAIAAGPVGSLTDDSAHGEAEAAEAMGSDEEAMGDVSDLDDEQAEGEAASQQGAFEATSMTASGAAPVTHGSASSSLALAQSAAACGAASSYQLRPQLHQPAAAGGSKQTLGSVLQPLPVPTHNSQAFRSAALSLLFESPSHYAAGEGGAGVKTAEAGANGAGGVSGNGTGSRWSAEERLDALLAARARMGAAGGYATAAHAAGQVTRHSDQPNGKTVQHVGEQAPELAKYAALQGLFSTSSTDETMARLSYTDTCLQGSSAEASLIVVASLLENVPNMAGLCRSCESFGAAALVLPSKALAGSDAFKRQAVTSDKWLPLAEVSPSELAGYLREMSARGYTIVGVEQASNSVPLQSYPFPRRCVLLLGNEQSGIPAPLMRLLHACVEIPMRGVTRSLNAHVSGALATWQWLLAQQTQE